MHEDSDLSIYLQEISRYKPLSPHEEYNAAVEIKQGDEQALERLVKANLRFVVSVASVYQNQGLPLADLINEGNIGLIRAARRFDEKKNFKFISYAVWWIRQAILQALADHSRIVRIPLNRVGMIHRVGKAHQRLEQKYRRRPSIQEVASDMRAEPAQVQHAMEIATRHVSLNAPGKQNAGTCVMDLIQDHKQSQPDDLVVRKSDQSVVHELLDCLTERERRVICLYFGIGEETNYTLEEIGIRANITRERVRQIKERALEKLKKRIDVHHLPQSITM